MAEPSAVDRLKSLVAKHGLRLAWQTSHISSVGVRLRAVQVLDGAGRWVGGAACSIGRDGTPEIASEHCARALLGT